MELTIKNTMDNDLYVIFEKDGQKYILLKEYYYQRDTDDGLDYAVVEGRFDAIPLKEFLEKYAQQGIDYIVNYLWGSVRQYQEDMPQKKFEDYLKELSPAVTAQLAYCDITEKTACGVYLSNLEKEHNKKN